MSETRTSATSRIDVPGTLTFTAGITLAVYGLIEAGDKSWSDGVTIGAFAGAVAFLIAFGFVEPSWLCCAHRVIPC